MGNLIMRHKAFVGPPSFWNFRPANENFEKIREQAEAFINAIGAENVVSVTELAPSYAPFSVVVWYRVDAAEPNQPLQPATGAT
jgi:hypothetical protein